jgi:hypothetical protein
MAASAFPPKYIRCEEDEEDEEGDDAIATADARSVLPQVLLFLFLACSAAASSRSPSPPASRVSPLSSDPGDGVRFPRFADQRRSACTGGVSTFLSVSFPLAFRFFISFQFVFVVVVVVVVVVVARATASQICLQIALRRKWRRIRIAASLAEGRQQAEERNAQPWLQSPVSKAGGVGSDAERTY